MDSKIEEVYDDVQNNCRKRLIKKAEIDNIRKSTLELFDVTNCKCSILFCNESNCVGCEKEINIICSSETHSTGIR